MKKALFFLVALLLTFSVNAQITVNQNDFASVGTVLTLSDDTLPGSLVLGNAGPNQTWDFSAIHNHYSYVYSFVDITASPFASTFPNANLAIDISGQGFFFYMNSSPTALSAVGQSGDFLGTGNDISISLNPPDVIMEFPSTYLSSFTSNMAYDEKIYYNQLISGYQVDSVRSKSVTHKTSVIDAWGNVTTPEGTFACIRQKTRNEVTDTTWGLINTGTITMWIEFETDFQIEDVYSWYANGLGMPLVEITYDTTTNTGIIASWLQTNLTYRQDEYFTETINSEAINVYPNPVQDYFYIRGIEDYQSCSVIVYDALGRIIEQQEFRNNEELKFNSKKLQNGIYFIKIKTDNSLQIGLKFIKN
ncbi:MAG: T9SS type A sorting domain-containing protein [Bacteroidales bacterium]|nr:T9SS type A sorting domain-containing protein [Bacteroidales bacterium]